ncbi:MAG: ferrous iron transporter B, partial [Candidatus Omnitrophica bacterium]|nr:ferrous iron transporter B [Candidatus Omnitrophota bacterium]
HGDDPIHLPPFEIELTQGTIEEFNLKTGEMRKAESHARYSYIGRVIEEAKVTQGDAPHTLTERLDSFLLHPVAGPLILFLVFGFVFQSIYAWAGPLMDGVDALVGVVAAGADAILPESMFKSLIVDGIIAGVGNTIIFLPQILILFLFLGILEDSGYLARAAFMLDRLMSSVGLDGKSFVPLLSSFACAVPGIMATRTIPSRKDRLVTILVAPLMTCSARLPVYILVIGTVFEADRMVWGPLNLGGLVLLSLYLLGILGAIFVAFLLKKTLLKSPKPVLLLELPTYKLPSFKSIALLLWDRGLMFLRRAGTVILALTVVLWVLLTFPQDDSITDRFESQRSEVAASSELSEEEQAAAIEAIDGHEAEAQLKHSFGGQLGHLIEPIIAPLGFDWKMGIGIVASFAAREVFVSTMGVIYGIGGEVDENSTSLRDALQSETRPGTIQRLYTPLVGLSLLIFYAY